MARSDSSYAARTAFRFQSSVVDDAWLHEGLSDDDVDLPREVLNSTLDNEEDDEDEEGVTPFGEETWNDLALDSFLQHLESSEANASQSASTVAAEAQAAAMQALRQGGDALPQGGGLNTSARSDED
jgi:hypothetical protein